MSHFNFCLEIPPIYYQYAKELDAQHNLALNEYLPQYQGRKVNYVDPISTTQLIPLVQSTTTEPVMPKPPDLSLGSCSFWWFEVILVEKKVQETTKKNWTYKDVLLEDEDK